MPTDSDYVIFFGVLLAVLGAGLLRVGLMNLKREPPEDAPKRAAIHRSRYCVRYCSSADLSAEGSENRRLGLRGGHSPQWLRHTFKNQTRNLRGVVALARDERILGRGSACVQRCGNRSRCGSKWWIGARAQSEN